MSVGTGVRWQLRVAIGNPRFTGARLKQEIVDHSPNCTRLNNKTDWRLQLKVRNARGNDSEIPVSANPGGTIAVIRIPNETRWYVTSTFSF